jgi:hypothetical protein
MWTENLRKDPLANLLGAEDKALSYLTERNLHEIYIGGDELLWELPEVKSILKQQQPNGSWLYKGNRLGDEIGEAYELLETWKILRILVEKYGMTSTHSSINRAAEFILSYQTEEGDIRGILSNQFMPYYMGAILEILIKAGYENDKRVETGLHWLLDIRQDDGGWIAPLMLYKMSDYNKICCQPPVHPQKNLPFSHMVSGMVIRAFAAHSNLRKSPEAIRVGFLLKGRIFQKDVYSSRKDESYWVKFQFPFWWTNLLTVMDSLMRMEFSPQDADIQKGLMWLIDNQGENGLWKASYGKAGVCDPDYWVTYAICRILKYFLI